MTDWLSSRLAALTEREEAVEKREEEVHGREENVLRWGREAISRAEDVERRLQTTLGKAKAEFGRQQKLVEERAKIAGGTADSGVDSLLQQLNEFKVAVEGLERELAGMRRAVKDARENLYQGAKAGE